MYLQEYADRLQVIEDKIAFNFNSQINNEIILLRKELLILNSYYNQLGDMIDILSDNESDFLMIMNVIYSACRHVGLIVWITS